MKTVVQIRLLLSVLSLAVVYVMTACVTSGPLQPEYEPSQVIERIGSESETPEWASGAKPFYEEAGDVLFISTITMSGDARPEACSRAAADTGRVEILRQIHDNLTSSGQFEEVSATADPAVETLIAFLSQGKLSGLKVTARYWERREESDATGMRVLRLHCAAKVAMKKSLLESQLRAAIGHSGGNAEVRAKLLDAQKQFLDDIASSGGVQKIQIPADASPAAEESH